MYPGPHAAVSHADARTDTDCFRRLLKVPGVGAARAFAVINAGGDQWLLNVVKSKDVDELMAIRGIGRKLAENIVEVMKDQIGEAV